jgi:glycosyltransferase involved in cell wall biosynthesis
MIKKIAMLVCHNLYESKRHFTQKLGEAFERKNVQILQLQWPFGPVPPSILKQIRAWGPDLTCSFNQPAPLDNGLFFWDELGIPHWTILLDPVIYDLGYLKSPYSILSSVDRNDCRYMHALQFERSFFFPHAIDKALIGSASDQKEFDVVFPGTCYNPDQLRNTWIKQQPEHVSKALDNAVEMVLGEKCTTSIQAVRRALLDSGISPKEVDFVELLYYVDYYTRGIDRIKLIQSIREASVHVYGAKWKNDGEDVQDWSFYLGSQKNVTIHPPVSFEEMLEIIKRSRILLNSMPFFKDGSHERVLLGLACGALPMTTRSQYLFEQFEEGKEMLFYDPLKWDSVEGTIQFWLDNEAERSALVAAGQKKVAMEHTWDKRVEQALPFLEEWVN